MIVKSLHQHQSTANVHVNAPHPIGSSSMARTAWGDCVWVGTGTWLCAFSRVCVVEWANTWSARTSASRSGGPWPQVRSARRGDIPFGRRSIYCNSVHLIEIAASKSIHFSLGRRFCNDLMHEMYGQKAQHPWSPWQGITGAWMCGQRFWDFAWPLLSIKTSVLSSHWPDECWPVLLPADSTMPPQKGAAP